MAWALPMRRCIVIFHFSRAENFPLSSRLNLFVVFGHLAAGLMTTREILVKLGHDVELHRESRLAAELRRKYVIELEEMFDLDIAWTFYRRIYQRLRRLRGLDEMYRNVKELTEMLGQHDRTLDEIKADNRRNRLSVSAALLAVAIIGVTLWTSSGKIVGPTIFATLVVTAALIWGGFETWAGGIRRTGNWLAKRLRVNRIS
jgi:hypothetical protein